MLECNDLLGQVSKTFTYTLIVNRTGMAGCLDDESEGDIDTRSQNTNILTNLHIQHTPNSTYKLPKSTTSLSLYSNTAS